MSPIFDSVSLLEIREQDPLKQGLKHQKGNSPHKSVQIREQDPLKQGLKLTKLGFFPGWM